MRSFAMAALLVCAGCPYEFDLSDKLESPGEPSDPVTTVDTDVAPPADTDTADPVVNETAVPTACDGTCLPSASPFGGGSGTAADPYLICDNAHLDAVRDHPSSFSELCQDLDLAGQPWTPIPALSGGLDGNDFTIANLTMDTGNRRVPDLAFVRDLSGTLENLHFADPFVRGGDAVTSIVRRLVGNSNARVLNLRVTGAQVFGGRHVGGAIVHADVGTLVSGVQFEGSVFASGDFAGGVLDSCFGTCQRILAEGQMHAQGQKVAGVVQQLNGTLRDCVNRMEVSTDTHKVGGVVGILAGGGRLVDCYSSGTVRGPHVVGGVIAESWSGASVVERVYASGPVVVTGNSRESGGILAAVSSGSPSILSSVWDVQRTGQTSSLRGGEGLATAHMQDPAHPSFVDWGATWVLVPGNDPRRPWELLVTP
jgi:hypothetical protein